MQSYTDKAIKTIIYYVCYGDIANICSDNYMELYNSVPYDAFDMNSIESSVLSRILNSSCSDYIITVTDVMNAIAHLKSGKSDGSEGLFSDHFIHGRLLIIFMLFYLYHLLLCCLMDLVQIL